MTRTNRSQRKPTHAAANNGANMGFEGKLWEAADKLRNNVDPAEYKHVVLGLIFLKYISDAFKANYYGRAVRANTDDTSPVLDKHRLGKQQLKVELRWHFGGQPVNNANFALVHNGGHQERS